jgi:uncharacterized membrane protein YhaH (DUF805 family)
MDFGYLFTGFDGRINRKPYWIGLLVLVAVAILLMVLSVFSGLVLLGTGFELIAFIVQLVFIYPSSALMVKRLHDRDRPGYFAAFIFVPLILKSLLDLLGITGDPFNMGALDYLFGLIIFVVSVWFLIELGFLRGTAGPNQYGPDPLGGAGATAGAH